MSEILLESASLNKRSIDSIDGSNDILNLPSDSIIELDFDILSSTKVEQHKIIGCSSNNGSLYIVLDSVSHYLEECGFLLPKKIKGRDLYFFCLDDFISYLKSKNDEGICGTNILIGSDQNSISESLIPFDDIQENSSGSEKSVVPVNNSRLSTNMVSVDDGFPPDYIDVNRLHNLIQSSLKPVLDAINFHNEGRKIWKRITVLLLVSIPIIGSFSYNYLDRLNTSEETLKAELSKIEKIRKFEFDAQNKIGEIIGKKIKGEITASVLIIELKKLENYYSNYHGYHGVLSEAYENIGDFANALKCINEAINLSLGADNNRYLIIKQRIANRSS